MHQRHTALDTLRQALEEMEIPTARLVLCWNLGNAKGGPQVTAYDADSCPVREELGRRHHRIWRHEQGVDMLAHRLEMDGVPMDCVTRWFAAIEEWTPAKVSLETLAAAERLRSTGQVQCRGLISDEDLFTLQDRLNVCSDPETRDLYKLIMRNEAERRAGE